MARKLAEGKRAEQHRRSALAQYYRIKSDPVAYAEYKEKKGAYHKEYRERNRERLRLQSAQRWVENKEAFIRKSIAKRRKRMYGVDADQYQAMLEAQGGVCKICGSLPNPAGAPATRTLAVDHDHVTGVVRGLLCHACNKAIGFLSTVELLESATRYLKGH